MTAGWSTIVAAKAIAFDHVFYRKGLRVAAPAEVGAFVLLFSHPQSDCGADDAMLGLDSSSKIT